MAAPLGPIPAGFRFYKDLIATVAARFGLDPVIVAAVCWQESSFQADAFRFEPDFWNRYLKANPKYRHLNPRRVSSSYGLMQVMYCRVHEDKLTDNDALPPEHLFVPEFALNTGCALLKELYEWAGERKSPVTVSTDVIALAAYNGGRGGNDPAKNWPLKTAKYASEVLAKAAALRREYESSSASGQQLVAR